MLLYLVQARRKRKKGAKQPTNESDRKRSEAEGKEL